MNFTLTAPCGNCPFRTDCLDGWLGEDRAEEIAMAITQGDKTFSCHKTNDFDEDENGETIINENDHCAGALIMLEKMDQPNQMMRIAERLNMYDRFKLKMDSPVFEDIEEFIDHHA